MLYEPAAVVHHYVPAERVAWRYFWRRCFFVNREKVQAFAGMGEAANLRAEMAFVRRSLTVQTRAALIDVIRGHAASLVQLGVMMIGIAMAGMGNITGRLLLWIASRFSLRTSSDSWLSSSQIATLPPAIA